MGHWHCLSQSCVCALGSSKCTPCNCLSTLDLVRDWQKCNWKKLSVIPRIQSSPCWRERTVGASELMNPWTQKNSKRQAVRARPWRGLVTVSSTSEYAVMDGCATFGWMTLGSVESESHDTSKQHGIQFPSHLTVLGLLACWLTNKPISHLALLEPLHTAFRNL